MSFLVLRAGFELVRFDLYMALHDFRSLYDKVRGYPVRAKTTSGPAIEEISAAMNLACIWYWKQVRCLQRSASTVCMLRSAGFPAQMVIGAQQIPFRAHAWVELHGQVVNGKSYTAELYSILDRC